MDGLIALLIVIAVVNALTSGRRKKRQEAQRRALQGAQQAQAAQKPKPRPARQSPRTQAQPSTPEELQAHLAAMDAQSRPASKREEGKISTQGESEAEHAEHRRRIAAEEAARRLEHETLRDLREANRDKLRTAVIMSEVLGKPIALRPRTGYRR